MLDDATANAVTLGQGLLTATIRGTGMLTFDKTRDHIQGARTGASPQGTRHTRGCSLCDSCDRHQIRARAHTSQLLHSPQCCSKDSSTVGSFHQQVRHAQRRSLHLRGRICAMNQQQGDRCGETVSGQMQRRMPASQWVTVLLAGQSEQDTGHAPRGGDGVDIHATAQKVGDGLPLAGHHRNVNGS